MTTGRLPLTAYPQPLRILPTLFLFAAPSEIHDHIGEAHDALYRPEGGLMFFAECEPDLSLEQIEAICSGLEVVCRPPLL